MILASSHDNFFVVDDLIMHVGMTESYSFSLLHVGMTESYSSLSHSSAAIGKETHMQVAIKNLHIPIAPLLT